MQTDRIRLMAKAKGRSMSYLCRAMGVTPVYFNDIDKSGRNIPADKLEIIASCLETTTEYLSYKTDDPSPKEKEPVQALSEDEELVLQILRTMSIEQKKDLIAYLKGKS